MKKTAKFSVIVQFNANSKLGSELLDIEGSEWVVLQIENVDTSKYDYIAEIIRVDDFNFNRYMSRTNGIERAVGEIIEY